MDNQIELKDVSFDGLQTLLKLLKKRMLKITYTIQKPSFCDVLFWRPAKWTVELTFGDYLND